jgi:chemotaxis protein MotA
MKFFGFFLVFACTFGGYVLLGGKMKVILAVLPYEALIILGTACGAFIVGNSMHVIKETVSGLKCLVHPEAHSKDSYVELLSVMYLLFKLARTKGWLSLEAHIEEPENSELFNQFPEFSKNTRAVNFLCDYLRIISLGNENPHEIEALMDEEIETYSHERLHPSHAVQTMADGIPALGIVAAVLGVIKTMQSITEPPEVLGKMIGSALVGTFIGVWAAYGFVGPVASALGERANTEIMYYKCMKVTILAFLNGAAPQVAVEFGRKFLAHNIQPGFTELEDRLNELPAPA